MRRGPPVMGALRQTRESAYKPDSVPILRPATVIYLGQTSPSASLRPTWEIGRVTRSLLGLAPGGVCRAGPVARPAGGLLHHRFTLACEVMLITPLRDRNPAPDRRKTVGPIGGLFSVALSVGSHRLDVIQHRTLWSPDFPPPTPKGRRRPSGGLAMSGYLAVASEYSTHWGYRSPRPPTYPPIPPKREASSA